MDVDVCVRVRQRSEVGGAERRGGKKEVSLFFPSSCLLTRAARRYRLRDVQSAHPQARPVAAVARRAALLFAVGPAAAAGPHALDGLGERLDPAPGGRRRAAHGLSVSWRGRAKFKGRRVCETNDGFGGGGCRSEGRFEGSKGGRSVARVYVLGLRGEEEGGGGRWRAKEEGAPSTAERARCRPLLPAGERR